MRNTGGKNSNAQTMTIPPVQMSFFSTRRSKNAQIGMPTNSPAVPEINIVWMMPALTFQK